METRSNWDDDDQFTNKELGDREALHTREALPYESLLSELHTLTKKLEVSYFYDRSNFRSLLDWDVTSETRRRIWTLKWELRFQQMVFMLLKNQGVWFEAVNYIQTIAAREGEPIKKAAADFNANKRVRRSYSRQLDFYASEFLKTIDQNIKPDLKKFCLGIVDWLLQGISSGEYDFSQFIYVIFSKVKDIQNSKPNMIAPVKKQMETLGEILHFICIFAGKETNFLVCFRPWVSIAAALVILDWVNEKDEDLFAVVYPSLQKLNLSGLKLVESYIVVIKASKSSNVSEILVMREAIGRLTDMLLENLIVSTDDRSEMLREGLTLWMALLMDPPQAEAEDEKLICGQINLLVDKAESLIRSLCLDKLGEDIFERRNFLLNDFLEKMNKAKAEVIQLHVEIPGLSWNNVPQTNGRGFFDFLLGNLKKKSEYEADMFPFEKHLIAIFHKELSLLRPFLTDMFEQQDEHKELKDIWVQASNMAYLVDYVTDSCLSADDVPTWSNLMHLSSAIEQIQIVKTEVSKIRKNDQMYNNRVISAEVNSKLALRERLQANATTKDDVKVGFAKEEQRIIDRLTAGEVGFDIVAIVGMPGQGKTNLAQRVYQDSRVKDHFLKHAWCCISEAYDTEEILLDLLKNVGKPVSQEQVPPLSIEDLANRLRKCLKGQSYLVVLDDMWDVKAWNELKLSFPDDNNGSRILLTSRNQDVPLAAGPHCCIVKLYPLSFEESWKLLRMKVFEEDWCPPTLSDIGKTIAENCKGLPLAIVVVAGLLKKDKSVDSWKQTSESLKSQIASEGCMDILDLSYKHLPDDLKPCFLYLGAFQEDQIIDAKRLIQFWIAEGFIQSDGMKSMEMVANEYLNDLVARSLVLVAQKSSRNGIKKCLVHDLIRQLCLIKAKEERFFLVTNVSDDHSSIIRNDHYRFCSHGKWQPFSDSKPIVLSVRSLLVSRGRFYGSAASYFLKRFKLLRVLDLSYGFVTRSSFDEITQFIHLIFLSVACQFPVPSSIANLFRLEVLHLRYSRKGGLPCAVMKMANLRHIFASECRFEHTEDFNEMELRLSPPLANLESFTSFDFGTESSFKRVAQKVPNILKLGLRLSFCVSLSSYFKKLESLSLNLFVKKTEDISPTTLDLPLTLKKLNLRAKSPLSGAMISSIGKLSKLEVLKLDADFEDERWDVEDDEFLELKYLKLRSSSVQEWNVSEESFPCLEQLVVRKCRKLKELPGRFGAVATLERIEVQNCRDSVRISFQQIVRDQIEDSGNEDLQFLIS